MPFGGSFEAIGTRWQIDSSQTIAPEAEQSLFATIHARIDSFDRVYSRFREDSLVTQMSQRAGTYTMPEDAEPLLLLYQELYRHTGGAFTPLIGQVLVDAGYDATYSLQPGVLHSPLSWDQAVTYNHPVLTVHQPVLLDFGAAGKGYLIDLVSQVLQAHGIENFSIDAGGDIVQRTREPSGGLRVGLEHPKHPDQVIGVASIHNQSICGSAGNRRAWKGFHHIIDPYALSSPRHILATWVVADTGLVADALATSLFFVDASMLTSHYAFEYLVIFHDSSWSISPNFPGELFTQG